MISVWKAKLLSWGCPGNTQERDFGVLYWKCSRNFWYMRMDTTALATYVTSRIRAGIAKAEIHEELASLGWTEEETEGAYRAAVVALGAPVPEEGKRGQLTRKAGAVDIVINFFSFILLGIVATALGSLLFQVINLTLPDALDANNWYSLDAARGIIHYSVAALLIGFPLYYFALRLWFRKFREDEGRVESKLSKWLTYLVLLAAAITIVGDLIVAVYTFLQGEITLRFFLKSFTILGIAGVIFGFYYLERKAVQYRVPVERRVFQSFGRAMAVVMVVAVALGFVVGGSPTTQRARSLDATRAEHLASLADCVEQYGQDFGRLPTMLDELTTSNEYRYCASYMRDPETNAAYQYRVVNPTRVDGLARVGEFELCATFALSSAETPSTQVLKPTGRGAWESHEAGRQCDTVTARLTTSVPVTPPVYMPETTQPDSGTPPVTKPTY